MKGTVFIILVCCWFILIFCYCFSPMKIFTLALHCAANGGSIYDKRQNGNFCIWEIKTTWNIRHPFQCGLRMSEINERKEKRNDERIAINLMSYCFFEKKNSPRLHWPWIASVRVRCTLYLLLCISIVATRFFFLFLSFFSYFLFPPDFRVKIK